MLGVKISHPEKVLWPKSKLGPAVTKLDLAHYMEAAAARMLPHVADRPISIVRTPDGIEGETFYQRHTLKGTAVPMLAIKVSGEKQPFLGVDSAEALVALAQQAVTEIHPWGCAKGDPDSPERIILDLDPAPDLPFARVIEGALELRKRLTTLGLVPFVKTTGGKGLHVVVAIKKGASWAEVKAFAKAVATCSWKTRSRSATPRPSPRRRAPERSSSTICATTAPRPASRRGARAAARRRARSRCRSPGRR